jgi:hypothetical protein
MKARDFAPVDALQTEPFGAVTDAEQRREALLDALRGVPMGTYDLRMVAWAVRTLAASTLRVLVSWLERARGAGVQR